MHYAKLYGNAKSIAEATAIRDRLMPGIQDIIDDQITLAGPSSGVAAMERMQRLAAMQTRAAWWIKHQKCDACHLLIQIEAGR